MTNREKHRGQLKEILEGSACCGFLRKHVLKKEDCSGITCVACARRFALWLDEEAEEDAVDLRKIPVDAKMIVSNDGKTWVKRHFAEFDRQSKAVRCFCGGQTSWSTDDATDTIPWRFAKLAK